MTTSNQRGVALPVAIAALLTLLLLVFIVRGFLPEEGEATSAEATRAQVLDSAIAAAAEPAVSARRRVTAAPEQPTVDPTLRSRLNSLIREARSLVRDGRSQAMRIPEAETDAGLRTAAARSATEQWRRFVTNYSARVTSYGQQLTQTASGIGFDNPAYMVYQELSYMVNGLHSVGVNPASTTNIPMKYMRESRFDEATHHIDEALRYLREIQ